MKDLIAINIMTTIKIMLAMMTEVSDVINSSDTRYSANNSFCNVFPSSWTLRNTMFTLTLGTLHSALCTSVYFISLDKLLVFKCEMRLNFSFYY